MFEHRAGYPVAITSPDDEGLKAGMEWCIQHMEDGDHVTVWTHLKGNLSHNDLLEQFVTRHSDVDHVTARGGAYMRGSGPALMAWADQNDISEFTRGNANRIRALCVVSWDEDRLRPWVAEVQPEMLGDTAAWDEPMPRLDPVVEEAMKSMTLTMNHNNTISAGYEKDEVVSALLALHDAGYHLDGSALAGWVIAHGWLGRNPARLEKYVEDINRGVRPRVRRMFRGDYIDYLRTRSDNRRDR
ncbi:hypothetical protein [Propioniciclava flava]|uniref:Uncharacterized protein n=1 Tax=Propioniciclava flava TaxID=2072026 RepID=A0A4Q2EL18_9ACTN|nr:hypothetical protein [Propioniciclava flava]RXW33476.1 hypothetical protein C1706_01585 [Propioniciclava flava]